MKLVIHCVDCGRILIGKTNSTTPPFGKQKCTHLYLSIHCGCRGNLSVADSRAGTTLSWDEIRDFFDKLPDLKGSPEEISAAAGALSSEGLAAVGAIIGLASSIVGGLLGWYLNEWIDPESGTRYTLTEILEGKRLKKRKVIRDSKELGTVNTATYKQIEVFGVGEVDPALNVVSVEYTEVDLAESDLDADGAYGAACLHYGQQTSTSVDISQSTYIPGTHAKICRQAAGGFSGVKPQKKTWPPGYINLPVNSDGSVYITLTVDQNGATAAKQYGFVCAIVSLWG